jgi:hypothetical protein
MIHNKFISKNLDLNGYETAHIFNYRKYFEKEFKCEASILNIEDYFDINLIFELFKRFEFINHSTLKINLNYLSGGITEDNFFENIPIKNRPNFYFKHKEFIIMASIIRRNETDDDKNYYDVDYEDSGFDTKNEKNINSSNSKLTITIYQSVNYAFKDLSEEFSFIKKYKITKKEKEQISILIKNTYNEYDFEPLNIKTPKNMDLALNYGKDFVDVYDKIVYKLKNNNRGLYLFHGEPGTGKSSFIKYLTSVIDKEFIFVPSMFIDKFICDVDIFSILLNKKKSILILEDAEKIIASRNTEDNQFISTLLNLTDGILSDILEVSVILTYNCDDARVDSALKRKGRTLIDYSFNKLSIEDSKKLAKD